MSKKKTTAFPATHQLGELLLQAAAEMEAQNAWDQKGERPTDVARAFVALLFEGQGQPIKSDFAEEIDTKAYHSDLQIRWCPTEWCMRTAPEPAYRKAA